MREQIGSKLLENLDIFIFGALFGAFFAVWTIVGVRYMAKTDKEDDNDNIDDMI